MPASKDPKYVFITGGVVSSLGKGLASAALGAVLQARGFKVRLRKLDPYLNVDPGTMNPNQHGEVFVTEDGAETDLDLGHYERFTGVDAHKGDNITAGQIYTRLLAKERKGEYLGGTVQVIPHVTDLIKEFITAKDKRDGEDFVLCEIGGTVGDIEGLPFFEAIRQVGYELGRERVLFMHVTLVPYIAAAKELKTKPTQHSVKELRSIGIQPDILLCRAEKDIPQSDRKKIALFCNLREENVIQAPDLKSIYQAPVRYSAEGLDRQVLNHFGYTDMAAQAPDLGAWERIMARYEKPSGEVNVAIVGKYMGTGDAYKSLNEALTHAGIANDVKVNVRWIDAHGFEKKDVPKQLETADAILVPGGFGSRGVEGKLSAIRYARENKIPYLGICFGMQLATIEIARNLVGMQLATSSEFGGEDVSAEPTPDMPHGPLVGIMTEWAKEDGKEKRSKAGNLGGTMRLGAYPCAIAKGSLAEKVYGATEISERHRHRYEVNTAYIPQLEKVGARFSGMSPDGKLPEIIEFKGHPWFLAVQFHPELKSRPFAPHPLFADYVRAAAVKAKTAKKAA